METSKKKKYTISRETLSAVFGGATTVLLADFFLPHYFFFGFSTFSTGADSLASFSCVIKNFSIVLILPVFSWIATDLLVLDLWFHFSLMIAIDLPFKISPSSFSMSVCTLTRRTFYCPSQSHCRLVLIVFLEVQLEWISFRLPSWQACSIKSFARAKTASFSENKWWHKWKTCAIVC